MSTNYRKLLKSKNQVSDYKVSTPKKDEELKKLYNERGRDKNNSTLSGDLTFTKS
jgi:hypothetical protein